MFDIHPVIVHFPIALLTLYFLTEIFSTPLEKRFPRLPFTKLFLLFFGAAGTWAAAASGEIAEENFEGSSLVEAHSASGEVTMWIFTIIAAAYLWRYVIQPFIEKKSPTLPGVVTSVPLRLSRFILARPIAVGLSFIGLLSLTITGALGGAIVYGPDTDPVVSFVYGLFLPFLN